MKRISIGVLHVALLGLSQSWSWIHSPLLANTRRSSYPDDGQQQQQQQQKQQQKRRHDIQATASDVPIVGPVTDTPLTSLDGLFEAAERASKPMDAETTNGAHDAFRYEWGRWVDDDAITRLMERMNQIQLTGGRI